MAITKDEFFQQPMYMLHVTGWPPDAVRPNEPLENPVVAPDGARLALWPTDPGMGGTSRRGATAERSTRLRRSRWSTAATGRCGRQSGPGRPTWSPTARVTGW